MNDQVCPVCGGAMWDNRQDKKNPKGPDFTCKQENGPCKYQYDKVYGWVPGDFKTGVWVKGANGAKKNIIAAAKENEQAFVNSLPPQGPQEPQEPTPPDYLTPKGPSGPPRPRLGTIGHHAVPPTPMRQTGDKSEVYEAKDRTSMAQTCLNAAATVHQGRDVDTAKLLTYADQLYTWLVTKRNVNG